MYEVNNPANATEIISVNELSHLRVVNVELLEALHIISRSTMDPFICGTALEALRKARG